MTNGRNGVNLFVNGSPLRRQGPTDVNFAASACGPHTTTRSNSQEFPNLRNGKSDLAQRPLIVCLKN